MTKVYHTEHRHKISYLYAMWMCITCNIICMLHLTHSIFRLLFKRSTLQFDLASKRLSRSSKLSHWQLCHFIPHFRFVCFFSCCYRRFSVFLCVVCLLRRFSIFVSPQRIFVHLIQSTVDNLNLVWFRFHLRLQTRRSWKTNIRTHIHRTSSTTATMTTYKLPSSQRKHTYTTYFFFALFWPKANKLSIHFSMK